MTQSHSCALIVEGGAMRGVFSCGVLDHFLAANFSPFNNFWGVSAGASNLAAYLAKMPGRNLKVYLDYSLRNEFLSPAKFVRGGHMLNLDWMWEITLKELGIDLKTLKSEHRPFYLGVTCQEDGKAEYLTPSLDMLTETIKASSAIPILYRNGVSLGNKRYVDGGVSDAIPVAQAIKRGATKIMVLRSRPASYRKSKSKLDYVYRHLLKDTPALIEPVLKRHEQYNNSLDLIKNPPAGVEVIQICPPENFKLKRLSRSIEPLREAYQLGNAMGASAIKQWSKY